MPVIDIMQTVYNNGKNEHQEDFFIAVASLKRQNWHEMDAQARQEFETQIISEFTEFAEKRIIEIGSEVGEKAELHWRMAVKSGFRTKILEMYPHAKDLFDIILKKYFIHLINQYL